MSVILVVPTIREDRIRKFLKLWEPALFDRIIVVEDNPLKTFDLSEWKVWHYAWEDIDYELADKAWIIPRRTDCVRSYGFLKAWDMEAEYIITLDDDCYPESPDVAAAFVQAHVDRLDCVEPENAWISTFRHHTLAPRGVPYNKYRDRMQNAINVGLWHGVPDTGAVEALAFKRFHAASSLAVGREAEQTFGQATFGKYVPMCGMNLAFHASVMPLMYFLLMGHSFKNGALLKLPFDRFGDIWAGLFAKRALDHLRLGMSWGSPKVVHERASDIYNNIAKEAPALGVHEQLWQFIDGSVMEGITPVDVYLHLADRVEAFGRNESNYWQATADAMRIWAGFFSGDQRCS